VGVAVKLVRVLASMSLDMALRASRGPEYLGLMIVFIQ